MAGYSGTPLAQKLGIKPGSRVLAIDAPKDYPFATVAKGSGRYRPPLRHLARRSRQAIAACAQAMTIDGAIWVSWYKKAAKIPTDVTEDVIRKRALATDLVDVKVCAVDDQWSGLKLVVRKALR